MSKSLVVASLLVVLVAACKTESEPQPAPERPAAAVDLASLEGRTLNAEDFVHECQRLGGANFTYTADTQAALRAASVRVQTRAAMPAAEFETYVRSELERCGFTCKPVGPEHLHVVLIERRA
jgi:hypothetical protein